MSDIVEDAKAWLETRPARRFGDGRAHHEACHETHIECLVARLVAEVERHRMTEMERAMLADAVGHCGYSDWAMALRPYLARTAPKEKP